MRTTQLWRGWTAALVIGWLAVGALAALPASAGQAASGSGRAGDHAPPLSDREAIQAELGRPMSELRSWSTQALQAYIQRLAHLSASLEATTDVPPAEHQSLTEQLLARTAQVALLVRQRSGEVPPAERAARPSAVGTAQAVLGKLAEALQDNSLLFIALLGGTLVVFAIGNLAGYRRGARQASYYGEGDPRIRFLVRPSATPEQPGESIRVTLPQIRDRLASGRMVMLQLGYEVAPAHRPRFLALVDDVAGVLSEIEGLTYTVWEDPRHPNRFYELLVCHRVAALDRLTATEARLAHLAQAVEACRVSGGPVLRRAWLAVLPQSGKTAASPAAPDASQLR